MRTCRELSRWAAAFALVGCLTIEALAVKADEALYVGGTSPLGKERPVFASYGLKIRGRINTTLHSNFMFEAGSKGSLEIPYVAILYLTYGPAFLSSAGKREPPKYPWSGWPSNRAKPYLRIAFIGHTDKEEQAVFELGHDIVRPVLEALQIRTGKTVEFQNLEACMQYRGREECGYGSTAELRGLKKILVDTSGSSEHVAGESRQRIQSAIDDARLGLEVVFRLEDAEVVLVFRYDDGSIRAAIPDRARGEVYVVDDNRMRVVVLFEEEWRAWKIKLATRFGNAFVDAYKAANDIK